MLRALGFTRGNVLLSFVIESIAIGTLGGLIGEVLAVAVATALGLNSRLMNVGEFIFSFRLTMGAFVSGLIAAAMIGAIGGLLPARAGGADRRAGFLALRLSAREATHDWSIA